MGSPSDSLIMVYAYSSYFILHLHTLFSLLRDVQPEIMGKQQKRGGGMAE